MDIARRLVRPVPLSAFFGATVCYANAAGAERVARMAGTDEVDLNRNHIIWVSPLGSALMKSAAGDGVVLHAGRYRRPDRTGSAVHSCTTAL